MDRGKSLSELEYTRVDVEDGISGFTKEELGLLIRTRGMILCQIGLLSRIHTRGKVI